MLIQISDSKASLEESISACNVIELELIRTFIIKQLELYEVLLSQKAQTTKLEKMVGCSNFISNVGITTRVRVSCSLRAPSILRIRLLRYFPLYFGPVRVCSLVTVELHSPLQVYNHHNDEENTVDKSESGGERQFRCV